MSYKFDISAADGVTITLTNTYGTEEYKDYAITNSAIDMLGDPLADDQMATGAAAFGTPHIDEYDEIGKTVVPEVNAFVGPHAFALRLYGGNQYVTLFPGDEIKIAAKGNAALYYAAIHADGIKIETSAAVITPMPYVEPKVSPFTDKGDEFYLDRGTGVGDESAINFDSEAYTEEIEKDLSL